MIERFPDEIDMLVAFSVPVYESNPKDGFWSYKFTIDGMVLIFSFDIFVSYVSTKIFLNDALIQVSMHEGAKYIDILDNKTIEARCYSADTFGSLTISLDKKPIIAWDSIVTHA